MKLELFHVDAFAEQIFQGNPAGVCLTENWLPDQIMQAIASELNLSETAFCVKRGDGDYRIRWFTPTTEVKLCGHATLACAHVLYTHLNTSDIPIRFHSLSGLLVAQKSTLGLCVDLPVQTVMPTDADPVIEDIFSAAVKEVYSGEDLVIMFSDASEVDIFTPDFGKIATLPYRGVCITAPGNGNGYDFVCRFFAPCVGVNEDPVTGSVFTKLAPIYALKLGKEEFRVRQISTRGGNVHVKLNDERVAISGPAHTVFKTTLELPRF